LEILQHRKDDSDRSPRSRTAASPQQWALCAMCSARRTGSRFSDVRPEFPDAEFKARDRVTSRRLDAERMVLGVKETEALRFPDVEVKENLEGMVPGRVMVFKERDECDHRERCEGLVEEIRGRLEADQALVWLRVNDKQLVRRQTEHEAEDRWKDELARVDEVWVRDSEEVAEQWNDLEEEAVDEEEPERISSELDKDEEWLGESDKMESAEDDLAQEDRKAETPRAADQMPENETIWSDSKECEEVGIDLERLDVREVHPAAPDSSK
jgi:hypothetical protein